MNDVAYLLPQVGNISVRPQSTKAHENMRRSRKPMPDPGSGMTRCYSTHPAQVTDAYIDATVTCSRSVYLPYVDTNRRGTRTTDHRHGDEKAAGRASQ